MSASTDTPPTARMKKNGFTANETELDLFQQRAQQEPLDAWLCWQRSLRILPFGSGRRGRVDLFVTIAAAVAIPVTILFTTLLVIPFDSAYADYALFDMAVWQVSFWLCQGPLMKLVSTWYIQNGNDGEEGTATSSSSTTTELPPATEWLHVLVAFWSHYGKSKGIIMVGAGFLTMTASLLASIFFYIPGIYCSILWFAVPCIILLEGGGEETTETTTMPKNDNNGKDKNNNQDMIVQILRAPRRSVILTRGRRWEIFFLLVNCFLAYTIPAGLLSLLSLTVYELTRKHILLGTEWMARFLSAAVYVLPTMAGKIVLLPLFIVLKTVLYMDMRKTREGLTREAFARDNPATWWTRRNAAGDDEQEGLIAAADDTGMEQVVISPTSNEDSTVVRRHVA